MSSSKRINVNLEVLKNEVGGKSSHCIDSIWYGKFQTICTNIIHREDKL